MWDPRVTASNDVWLVLYQRWWMLCFDWLLTFFCWCTLLQFLWKVLDESSVVFSLLSLTSVFSVIQTFFYSFFCCTSVFFILLSDFPALTFIFYLWKTRKETINFSYTCLGFFYEMLKKRSGKRVCWSEIISSCICWPAAIYFAIYCHIVLYFLISLLKQVNPEPRNPLWDYSFQAPRRRLEGGFTYISAAVKELIQHFILRESAAKKRSSLKNKTKQFRSFQRRRKLEMIWCVFNPSVTMTTGREMLCVSPILIVLQSVCLCVVVPCTQTQKYLHTHTCKYKAAWRHVVSVFQLLHVFWFRTEFK